MLQAVHPILSEPHSVIIYGSFSQLIVPYRLTITVDDVNQNSHFIVLYLSFIILIYYKSTYLFI